MRNTLLLLLCLPGLITIRAQSFIKNDKGRALTFKEIQLQFDQFRRTHDLEKEKQWKSYKRHEMDMLMHTNGRGEPDGFSTYVNEALRVAAEKESQSSAAGTWLPTGPADVPDNLLYYAENGIGRINCVAFHPTDVSTYYVGVAQGGLWKTTNGGNSYTPLTDNLPITRISDITIDPNNTSVIYISVCDFEYVGTGLYLDGRKRHSHYGLGVYKSTNGGQSWTATGLTFQLTNGDASLIRKILVNPSNSSELLACGVNGMYKSTNGGTSWVKSLDSLFWDMEADPTNGAVIYAATGWIKTANIGHAAIYKSTNFGNNWIKLNNSIPYQGSVQRIKLAVARSNANYVYALCVDNTDGFYGLYRSTNAGSTWTYMSGTPNILHWDEGNDPGGQGDYDLALCVNDTNENIIYTGGINIWSSHDGGTTFSPVTHWTYQNGDNTIHADVHAIQRQPVSGKYFVACDGGLYRTDKIDTSSWSSTWTTYWQNLSHGMQISSFYRLSSSKNMLNRLAAGAQDNSTMYNVGFGWSTIFGGDGMDNYLHPTRHQHVLASSQYGNFYFSEDNGLSGNYAETNPNFEDAEWVTPVVAWYTNPDVVYIGNENVVQSIDGGENWSALASIYSNTVSQTNTEISALAVAPSNSNVVYAARRVRHEIGMKGIVFRTINGGASFVNITSNLPDTLYYTGIEVSPTSTNEAVVCMAGFAAGIKVFRTVNGGAAWTNISANLPNVPVNCIKYIEPTGQLIVATDLGIYVLNKGATLWTNYSVGLPNVITTDIEINPAINEVFISTFGRGIWQTELGMIQALQTAGIEENPSISARDFNVYPTINNGSFTIETLYNSGPLQLQIIDVMGRMVYTSSVSQPMTHYKLQLAPGSYYLKLGDHSSHGVKKLVVE